MPQVMELRLSTCPNLMQGFMCVRPSALTTLCLTGVPGLDEQPAVHIATSCCSLTAFDISRVWGPYMCLSCVRKVICKCTKLIWFDFCPHKPKWQGWVTLLSEHGECQRHIVRFGPFVCGIVGVEDDTD